MIRYLKNSIIILGILILSSSCSRPEKFGKSQFYGYFNPLHSQEVYLAFLAPDLYSIMKYDSVYSGGDVLNFVSIEKGTYKINGDSLILLSERKESGNLYIINDEILLVNKLRYFIQNDTLFCAQRDDKKGNIIYSGNWGNGKKEGEWVYEHKKFTEHIVYKEGKVVKRYIESD